ncbi:MAG: hypothetical protein QW253_00095 [Metallosphaera sp.]
MVSITWQLVVIVAITIVCATVLAVFSGNVDIFKYTLTAVLSFLSGLGVGAYIVWKAITGRIKQ